MKEYKNLEVWKRAHRMTIDIYQLTKSFPKEEQYGLTSQLRRAMASVSTNITEGCGRNSQREFSRFLQISGGSASEVEYLILLTRDLKFIKESEYQKFVKEIISIQKMLHALIKMIHESSD